jgi:hypothetical protein
MYVFPCGRLARLYGKSMGYRCASAPINRLRTDQAVLMEYARFRGFD